ncbi:MAG: M48 metallopeptidase family protein [Opitutaceae bacterium]
MVGPRYASLNASAGFVGQAQGQAGCAPSRGKWASCSTRGRVCFARDLLDRSPHEQDYVIVHELLHLRHPNHERVFRALLTAHLPRWRETHCKMRAHPRALRFTP